MIAQANENLRWYNDTCLHMQTRIRRHVRLVLSLACLKSPGWQSAVQSATASHYYNLWSDANFSAFFRGSHRVAYRDTSDSACIHANCAAKHIPTHRWAKETVNKDGINISKNTHAGRAKYSKQTPAIWNTQNSILSTLYCKPEHNILLSIYTRTWRQNTLTYRVVCWYMWSTFSVQLTDCIRS